MAYRLNDYVCNNCGLLFEELVSGDEAVECLECKSTDTQKMLSTPKLATMNLLSPQDYKKKMLKRSEDHTIKNVMKEQDKYDVRRLRNK